MKPTLTLALMSIAGPSFVSAFADAVPLQNATATFSQTYYDDFSVGKAINGTTADYLGWAIYDGDALGGITEPQVAVFETVTDVGFSGGSLLQFTMTYDNWNPYHFIGSLRLSVTTDDRSTFADGLASGGDVTANWITLDPSSAISLYGATLTEQPDHSILASGTLSFYDAYVIEAHTTLTGITGIRLEVLADASLPTDGPGRQPENGNFVLSELGVSIRPHAVPDAASTLGLSILGFGLLELARRRR